MINNYVEYGYRLHRLIIDSGYKMQQIDGVWLSSDDPAVQAIIDNFDPLPEAKAKAKERIGIEASKRVAIVYPLINPTKNEAVGLVNLVTDILVQANAAAGLSGDLLTVKNISNTVKVKIAEVNAETDWQLVDAYDASTGW